MTITRHRRDLRGVRSLTFDECDDCGALVGDVDKHRDNCPRIQPPKPEPIPVDTNAWASIIHAHRHVRTIELDEAMSVRCTCGQWAGLRFAHSRHVAEKLAEYTEAQR